MFRQPPHPGREGAGSCDGQQPGKTTRWDWREGVLVSELALLVDDALPVPMVHLGRLLVWPFLQSCFGSSPSSRSRCALP